MMAQPRISLLIPCAGAVAVQPITRTRISKKNASFATASVYISESFQGLAATLNARTITLRAIMSMRAT